MILIGMFDSPFVRRVAISMRLLGMAFEHRSWSVGRDFDRIREYNPLGRVPALVLDDGATLCESDAILDWLDQQAGPARALLPASGIERRQALQLMSLAMGAAEKGVQQIMEIVFRPAEKRHAPFAARLSTQMHGALGELEKHAAARGAEHWLVGEKLTQADITVVCAFVYLREAVGFDVARYPALVRHVERCNALPAFIEIYLPFDAPQSN